MTSACGIESAGRSIAPELFAAHLLPRRRDSHKGSFGSAAILGGAPGMAGAALLAGRAALKLGAGRVYVGMLERLAVDAEQPELMLREPGEALAPRHRARRRTGAGPVRCRARPAAPYRQRRLSIGGGR